jgi:hypothetical protein
MQKAAHCAERDAAARPWSETSYGAFESSGACRRSDHRFLRRHVMHREFPSLAPYYNLEHDVRPANSEVTKRGALEDQRLARGIDETGALSRFDHPSSVTGTPTAFAAARKLSTLLLGTVQMTS